MNLSLRVAEKKAIATDVQLFELVHPEGADLPVFTAGAHITVLTPNGLTRRYSLCNSPLERQRYCIAVKREAQGKGGSVSLIDGVQAGDMLSVVSGPLNYFELSTTASSHLLIAGGIGITPVLSMLHALHAQGAKFQLVYLSRTKQDAAFLDVLSQAPWASQVTVHHDQGDMAKAFDLRKLLSQQAPDQHLYCCGPRGLMQAVRELSKHWSADSVHFEDFGSSEQPDKASAGEFEVRLKKSGVTVKVPAEISILEALRRQGVAVPSSCESGTCGTCRTPLLSGVAQHLDYVLDEDEQVNEIMICVSRAKSRVLELDI
jgi:phthalate 4,5-dioxygenase reductase component